jgi:ammonia channel protein AmtB
MDFAGGGMVHVAGGSAGLIATIMIGARIDRFSPSKADDFKPNNIVKIFMSN